MSTKKKLLLTGASILMALLTVCIYFYYRFNRESHLADYIPADAESVYYINSKVVFKRFFLQKDAGIPREDFKSNPYLASIKNIRETGIDLLSDAAYIQYKGIYYGLFLVNDEDQIGRTLQEMEKGLFGPPVQGHGYQQVTSLKDSFQLLWNDNVLLYIPKAKNFIDETFIHHLFKLDQDQNFKNSKLYTRVKNENALVWFYVSHADIKISAPSALKGYLNWDSSIHIFATENINSDNLITPNTKPVLGANINSVKNLVFADTGNHFINSFLLTLSHIYLPEVLEKLSETDMGTHQKTLRLLGPKELKSEIVTYVYDDNFNKQKIVKSKTDTINSASLCLSNRSEHASHCYSNNPDSLSERRFAFPPNVQMYASFNQEFLSPLYPVPVKYDVQFIKTYNQTYHQYWLDLDFKDWQKLFAR